MGFKIEEMQEKLIDEGDYQAIIVDAKEIHPKANQGFYPYLKLVFEIQKGEFAGEQIQKNFYSFYENKRRGRIERELFDKLKNNIFGDYVGEIETEIFIEKEIGITVSHYNGNHQIKSFWSMISSEKQPQRAIPPVAVHTPVAPQKLATLGVLKQDTLNDEVPF